MAYKLEKEENGSIALVIGGFDDGIAQDPYTGIQYLENVNIGTVPGEVSVGFGLTASTISGATLGVPISKAVKYTAGAAAEYYVLDADGHVFSATSIDGTWTYLSSGATLTGASSLDSIVYFQGYLLKFRNTSIDYWNGSTWTNGWNPSTGGSGATGTITSAQHFALSAQDNAVYFCNATKIGSILGNSSAFDPTNTATYTFNASALALPTYDYAQCLAQQSTNLLVGGSLNAVYPWDRISTSFSYPIFIADQYIRKMVTANTNVFIFTGNVTGRGRIYLTNGTNANLFYKFPDHISGYQEPYYKFYDAIWHRNSLMFGVEVTQNGNGNVITGPTAQVWAVGLENNSFRSVSTITGGSGSGRLLIPDESNTQVSGLAYAVAYSNGSTHGISYSDTSAGTGSGTIKSDIMNVGTFVNKKTFSQVEFKLGYPLQSGESIALSYVADNTTVGSIGTFTSSTSTISDVTPVTFEKCQWLQITASLTGNSAVSGCRLKEIRLR